jgi:hypothetical protein
MFQQYSKYLRLYGIEWQDDKWIMYWKGSERSCSGQIWGTILAFAWKDWGKSAKASVRTDGLWGKMWKQEFHSLNHDDWSCSLASGFPTRRYPSTSLHSVITQEITIKISHGCRNLQSQITKTNFHFTAQDCILHHAPQHNSMFLSDLLSPTIFTTSKYLQQLGIWRSSIWIST